MEEKNLKPGEILPYHPNFGITEREYELLISSAKNLQLVHFDDVSVLVETVKDRTKVTILGEKLKFNFILDAAKNVVQTSRQTLTDYTVVNQKDENSPLGAWKGHQWKVVNENMGYSEKLAIGKRDRGNTGIIYYDLNSARDKISSHFVITYPL